jgi:thymidylate synthase
LNKSSSGKQWSSPLVFPEPESSAGGGLPSEETVFTVRGQKVWQTWIRVLREVMRFGRPSPMIHHYGAERISEIFNLTAVVYGENPENPELPKWLPYSADDIKKYVASFLSASRGDEAYTYGERIKAFPLEGYDDEFLSKVIDFSHCESRCSSGRGNLVEIRQTLSQAISGKSLNQQKLMAAKLKSFPENKGAMAVLWEPIIDNFGLREIWRTPCLVLVQAVIRDKRLFLTAYFRSNDMYGGWFLNAFGLLAFQKELAGMIGKDIKLGPLTTISHSAHIYESSWQLAEKLVHDHWIDVSCEWDPRGNLNIETDGKFIVVKHLSPDGIFLDEYRQNGMEDRAAKRLCFALESAGLFSTIGNAMYAGRQIERAETAVKLGIEFTSDEALNFQSKKVTP